jgi:lipoic acid synthetase
LIICQIGLFSGRGLATLPAMSSCHGPQMKMDGALHQQRKPDWIKVRLPNNPAFWSTKALITDLKLVTVCEEAQCPNRWECWGQGTATFMIAGDKCTRACGFCAVKTARPDALEADEPARVAEATRRMKLRHIVITAVARDDLKDGGAQHFQQTIEAVRALNPGIVIEVLVPDFNDRDWALQLVMDARPHIFNHNLETVERLTPLVRSRAKYARSLTVLKKAKAMVAGKVATKSGIMLGLGEREEEILRAMDDLLAHDVTVLTLGQYLRPTPRHLPVVEFIHPDKFAEYKQVALDKGFRHVASGPLVRSSYHAADFRPELDILEDADRHARPTPGLELDPEFLPIPAARESVILESLK